MPKLTSPTNNTQPVGEGNAFSFSQIKDFDVHIAREIRGYDIMDKIIIGLADYFIEDNTNVIDIGCSTGRLIRQLAQNVAAETDPSRRRQVSFTGYEPNHNLAHNLAPTDVKIRFERVTSHTKFDNASLIFSIFTLQFLPLAERPAILKNIYQGLNPNGAFIWAEKVYSDDPQIESLINRRHLAFKRQFSSAENILGKDDRLQAVMHTLSLPRNLSMLRAAGFKRYDTFWRVNNFVCLLAIK